ncbi:MAG: hypothetical protein CMO80_18400 [Verrucomicrobiales bacterium]|nr:hypothetical protein [Verrucomicrobiales bacterium]|tara:strand:- start:6236 stop:6859 length:624 start_codon:yes stop_codon:yes gene_type:complete
MLTKRLGIAAMLLVWLAGQLDLSAVRYNHRATRLGHPATCFAPPLRSAEDLRDRFCDAKPKPGIASILNQAGWTGKLEDIHHAALNNEIVPHQIPVGHIMPFMSSREDGKPITLKTVIWAGKASIQAFAFRFVSSTGASRVSAHGGRNYKSAPFPNLPGKETAEWPLTTRALPTPGESGIVDSRRVVYFSSDQITDPIREEESAQVY